MKEQAVLYIVSNITIIAACLLLIGALLAALIYKRHQLLAPALLWLISKTLTHIAYLLVVFKVVGPPTVVAFLAVNAAISVVSSVYLVFMTVEWIRSPSLRDMQIATNAMAKTISNLTEGSK
jgi:hypothetical protein